MAIELGLVLIKWLLMMDAVQSSAKPIPASTGQVCILFYDIRFGLALPPSSHGDMSKVNASS
jgi:hypothetical protein